MSESQYPPDPVVAFTVAMRKGDLDAMRRFAQQEPDLFRKLLERKDWVVCEAGRHAPPEAIPVLIELGAPVNQQDSNDWTGLAWAVVRGRYEVAKALLECGADPNLDCPIFGVTDEDVEDPVAMAELLLDYGADINQLVLTDFYPPRTVLSRAIDEGRTELVRFLKSRGAELPSALPGGRAPAASPPVIASGDYTPHILGHFRKHYGQPSERVVREIVPTSPVPVVISYIRPSWRRRYAVIFTVGLSRFELSVPKEAEQFRRAELMMVLPRTWPPPQQALKDPRWAWPIQWLLKIAAYPVENNTWLGAPMSVLVEEEPPKPLGPGTRFTAWLLVAGEEEKRIITCRDGTTIQIYSLCPLYTEEYLFERQNGIVALLSQMERYGFPEQIDVNRVNVVTGR